MKMFIQQIQRMTCIIFHYFIQPISSFHYHRIHPHTDEPNRVKSSTAESHSPIMSAQNLQCRTFSAEPSVQNLQSSLSSFKSSLCCWSVHSLHVFLWFLPAGSAITTSPQVAKPAQQNPQQAQLLFYSGSTQRVCALRHSPRANVIWAAVPMEVGPPCRITLRAACST